MAVIRPGQVERLQQVNQLGETRKVCPFPREAEGFDPSLPVHPDQEHRPVVRQEGFGEYPVHRRALEIEIGELHPQPHRLPPCFQYPKVQRRPDRVVKPDTCREHVAGK